MKKRASGLLLPLSALPGGWGFGSFGAASYAFIDFLAKSRQSYWQILPLGPTGVGDSPYQTFSSAAISPYYIDVDLLKEEGLLYEEELQHYDCTTGDGRADYGLLYEKRFSLLRIAASRMTPEDRAGLEEFLRTHAWAKPYALFMSLKSRFGGAPWHTWPKEYRDRDPQALEAAVKEDPQEFDFWAFTQYKAREQWDAIRAYAKKQRIQFIGDIPFYVAHDSADVWISPQYFQLSETGDVLQVAGYPPDAFSDDGQLWGNPIFRWDLLQRGRYDWWTNRLAQSLALYDIVRLDHFLGFENYWSIPAGEHPREGRWEKGPGEDLFVCAREALGELPLIAEDLGLVSEEVIRLRQSLGMPGMRILQFAFDPEGDNEHLPHNYSNDSVVYTGTHDNETMKGWWEKATEPDRTFAQNYLRAEEENLSDIAHSVLMASVADLCILPVQDLMNLGSEGRFNVPNTLKGNWSWRLDAIPDEHAEALAEKTLLYRRTTLESI